MFQSFVTDHNFFNGPTLDVASSLTLTSGNFRILGYPQGSDFTRFGFPSIASAVEDTGVGAFIRTANVSNNNCLFSYSCNCSLDTTGLTAYLVRIERPTELTADSDLGLFDENNTYYPVAISSSSSDGVLSLSGKVNIDTYPRIKANKYVYVGLVFYARNWNVGKGLLSFSLRQVVTEPPVFQPMK